MAGKQKPPAEGGRPGACLAGASSERRPGEDTPLQLTAEEMPGQAAALGPTDSRSDRRMCLLLEAAGHEVLSRPRPRGKRGPRPRPRGTGPLPPLSGSGDPTGRSLAGDSGGALGDRDDPGGQGSPRIGHWKGIPAARPLGDPAASSLGRQSLASTAREPPTRSAGAGATAFSAGRPRSPLTAAQPPRLVPLQGLRRRPLPSRPGAPACAPPRSRGGAPCERSPGRPFGWSGQGRDRRPPSIPGSRNRAAPDTPP